jgi:hypothetical protein
MPRTEGSAGPPDSVRKEPQLKGKTRNPALGIARHNEAALAARDAARQAKQQLASAPIWALAFGGGRHEPESLLAGLREELGDIPIIGGSAVGLITRDGTTLTGFECGVLLFAEPFLLEGIATESGLEDAFATGERLGRSLQKISASGSTVLLLYDSIQSSEPVELHTGSHLVDGLLAGLDGDARQLIGCGTLGDMAMQHSTIFNGHEACQHSAVAVAMPSTLQCHVGITHGCFPASDFMTITAIEGARVLELDGQPALAVAAEHLGLSDEELAAVNPATLPLTLGEKQGDLFAPFSDLNYNNRLVVAADPDAGALILTEADFAVGARVQLMGIEPQRMIDSAQEQTERLLASLGDREPLFALYIDCAGRSMAYSGTEEDESAPVRRLIGERCPLLGFFSGVEIAPVANHPRPLDWTGVLAVFTATDD